MINSFQMPKYGSYLNDLSSLRLHKDLNCIPTRRMEDTIWSSGRIWITWMKTVLDERKSHSDGSSERGSEPAIWKAADYKWH